MKEIHQLRQQLMHLLSLYESELNQTQQTKTKDVSMEILNPPTLQQVIQLFYFLT
jgi:hypothetical protein